ncbi:hypothetical protein HK102_006153, partial [Quaeritorhiza haematococci]
MDIVEVVYGGYVGVGGGWGVEVVAWIEYAWWEGWEGESFAAEGVAPVATTTPTGPLGAIDALAGNGTYINALQRRSDWMEDLALTMGPWSNVHVRKILDNLLAFRQDILNGVITPPPDVLPKTYGNGRALLCILVQSENLELFRSFWDLIFPSEHYYIIHIDAGASPLVREFVQNVVQPHKYPNVIIVSREDSFPRLDSLTVFPVYAVVSCWIAGLQRTSPARGDWDFEYVLNLSENDVPVIPVSKWGPWFHNISSEPSTSFVQFITAKDVPERFKYNAMINEWNKEFISDILNSAKPTGQYMSHTHMHIFRGSPYHLLHIDLVWRILNTPTGLNTLFFLQHSIVPAEAFYATAAVNMAWSFDPVLKLEPWSKRFYGSVQKESKWEVLGFGDLKAMVGE